MASTSTKSVARARRRDGCVCLFIVLFFHDFRTRRFRARVQFPALLHRTLRHAAFRHPQNTQLAPNFAAGKEGFSCGSCYVHVWHAPAPPIVQHRSAASPTHGCAPAHPAQRGIARKVTRVIPGRCMPDGCRRGQRPCSSPGGSGLSGGPRPGSTGRPETLGVIPAPTTGRQCRIRVPPASTPRPAWTWERSSGRAPISPGLSRDTRKNRN